MQKMIYDKGEYQLNSYDFHDDGVIDINATMSILSKNGILIEGIVIQEFGDIYDEKRGFSYNSAEEFTENSSDYKDMLIDEAILLCKINGIKISCGVFSKSTVFRIQFRKNSTLDNGVKLDSYSDAIANEVNNKGRVP